MRKIRKSKPPEQAIEQYTLYHTVVYTCPYCSAQLGGAETSRRPEKCPDERCVWLLDGGLCPFKRCVRGGMGLTVKAVDYRESNSSASFEPGDFCLYAFGKENKSKAVVEVVKVLDDPRGVAQVKFHRVLADDTGNGLFNYLRRTGDTMNASFEYLKKLPRKQVKK